MHLLLPRPSAEAPWCSELKNLVAARRKLCIQVYPHCCKLLEFPNDSSESLLRVLKGDMEELRTVSQWNNVIYVLCIPGPSIDETKLISLVP